MKALAGSLSPMGVKSVPELRGINSVDSEPEIFRSAEEQHSAVIDAYSMMIPEGATQVKPKAIPVVKNNEILLQEYYEDSLDSSQLKSETSEKLNKIAKQVVGIPTSPERRITAYKRGVTEYQFDAELEPMIRDMKAKILADSRTSLCSNDSLDRSPTKECRSLSHTSEVCFQMLFGV